MDRCSLEFAKNYSVAAENECLSQASLWPSVILGACLIWLPLSTRHLGHVWLPSPRFTLLTISGNQRD